MLHKNINFKIVGMAFISIFIGGLFCDDTYAACTDDGVSCVAIEFGQPVGERTVNPSSNIYSATQFYLPVAINIEHAVGHAIDYSIKVYGSGNALANTNDANAFIPSIPQNTSYNDLGKNGSEWGMRWNFGDKVEDARSDYHPIPASIDDPAAVVIADGKIDKGADNITKQLTLGFAVAVDGNQASGSYSNTITVAVVASPKDVRDMFDIYYMQDMTTDICANTTTPNAGAISTGANINATGSMSTDTTGDHRGEKNFVPQMELIDKRDGKKYTVRKLADGNCWMVSNLEFDFVPAANKVFGQTPAQSAFATEGIGMLAGSDIVLTNKDTDLNSMREWTPAIAAETYGKVGTVYRTQRNAGKGSGTDDTATATTQTAWAADGSDGLRSFSSAAAYPSALYSTKTAATPTFGTTNTGSPWQKFGNFYNWTAATLGSSAKLTFNEEGLADDIQDAEDSICPRGWRLPSNTGGNSFSNLLDTYGLAASNAATVNQVANYPLNFLRTGHYFYGGGDVYYRRTEGRWWSATGSSVTNANALRVETTIAPQNGYPRGQGYSIRCVAR